MGKTLELYKGIYFYITTLLKEKNVDKKLLMTSLDDLLKFKNETSIDKFDYSSIRVAVSRIIVLSFLDLDNQSSSSLLSLLGLATEDEKAFQKELINSLKTSEWIVKKMQENLIKHTNQFMKQLNFYDLIAKPLVGDHIYSAIDSFIPNSSDLLDTLIGKRKNLKISAKNVKDINLATITDFYSPLTTSPFAFKIIDDYNKILHPIVEEVIKYKHIYNLYEIITVYKVTNFILTQSWRFDGE